MSQDFESEIIKTFDKLNLDKFRVINSSRHLFTCGGVVDATSPVPPSFRDRFSSYTAANREVLHNSIVLAEDFLDYFKDNAYPDLFVFEEEIARVSTLVLIFLESPGSLVELGIFSAIPDIARKLLIVAPLDKVQEEDSFIFLGPLRNLMAENDTSVATYPWPSATDNEYDDAHLIGLCDDIENRVKEVSRTSKFDQEDSGHLALLVAEIIRVCYPIQISEIAKSIEALGLTITENDLRRRLYLLGKLRFIDVLPYRTNRYYYPRNRDEGTVTFSEAKVFDPTDFRITLNAAYKTSGDSQSKKRRVALGMIHGLYGGGTQ